MPGRHRLVLLFVAVLLSSCGGDDTNPMDDGNDDPTDAVPTAPGTPNGSPTTTTIGPAGGSLMSADGALQLIVPAGALTTDTALTIQPITNSAWGGVGPAYRLTPDGTTFATPVSLVFEVTDELVVGSAAAFLDGVVQDDSGYWYVLKQRTLDVAGGTLTCRTSHFSDYSLIEGVQIRPASATIDVDEQVLLRIEYCFREMLDDGDDEIAALVLTCGTELAPLGTFTDWSAGVPANSSTAARLRWSSVCK
jgi:hypothetical protein